MPRFQRLEHCGAIHGVRSTGLNFERMAKFASPEQMNFLKPEEWSDWKQRFARYRIASKQNADSADVQVRALIYCMGPEAEHIFKSFIFGENEAVTYDATVAKFDDYFVPKRNVIFKRACTQVFRRPMKWWKAI